MDPQNRLYSPDPSQRLAALAPLPSVEHLRKQAKHLLAACRNGDTDALNRVGRWFSERPERPSAIKLSHAQLAVAREHGCASWERLRRSVLTALVERLAVRDWNEWRAAAAARTSLHRMGEDGLLAVVEGLSHAEPRVRRGAVDFLNRHGDARCVPKLAELVLRDPVPYVRWSALQALKRLGGTPPPGGELASVLARAAQDDPSPRVRWRAVNSLPTPELACAAREDPSPRVRLRALAALGGRAGSALAQQTLERALDDGHPDVRRAAHQALRRLSPEYRQLAAQRAREANLAELALA